MLRIPIGCPKANRKQSRRPIRAKKNDTTSQRELKAIIRMRHKERKNESDHVAIDY